MALKIALDAGHGMNTPGKRTPDGEREWSFNNKVLRAAEASLRRYKGVQILRTDDASGRTDVSLAERVRRANAWGADVFVSFHHNAMSGAWHSGGGTEVYAANSPSAKSVALAAATAPKIAKAMGLANRGVKRANFYVIRYTKMPAILVEGGFMDSRVDIAALRSDANLRRQGEAVAEAIAEVFGLKAGGVSQAVAPAESAVKSSTSGAWHVELGDKGANVKQMQRDLTALGYPLAADGSFGYATDAALRAFQKAQGLTVDGKYGPGTQAAVKKALAARKPSKPAAWHVEFGDTGARVGEAQKRMQALGYYGGKIDNSFGPAMRDAVKAFQRDNGLSADGLYGPATQKAAASAKPKRKESIYRVIIDGKQVGAYGENDNALKEARKAIEKGAKNIRIEKV